MHFSGTKPCFYRLRLKETGGHEPHSSPHSLRRNANEPRIVARHRRLVFNDAAQVRVPRGNGQRNTGDGGADVDDGAGAKLDPGIAIAPGRCRRPRSSSSWRSQARHGLGPADLALEERLAEGKRGRRLVRLSSAPAGTASAPQPPCSTARTLLLRIS